MLKCPFSWEMGATMQGTWVLSVLGLPHWTQSTYSKVSNWQWAVWRPTWWLFIQLQNISMPFIFFGIHDIDRTYQWLVSIYVQSKMGYWLGTFQNNTGSSLQRADLYILTSPLRHIYYNFTNSSRATLAVALCTHCGHYTSGVDGSSFREPEMKSLCKM